MSAPEITIAEAYAERAREAHSRGAKRRSKNTGVRALEEVRATFRDATTQIGVLARKQHRSDFEALARVMHETLRYLLSIEPHTPAQLETALRGIGAKAFSEGMRPETDAAHRVWWEAHRAAWKAGRFDDPNLYLPVTHEGLAIMQCAVAERVAAGTLPPAPHGSETANVVNFVEARAARVRRDPTKPRGL